MDWCEWEPQARWAGRSGQAEPNTKQQRAKWGQLLTTSAFSNTTLFSAADEMLQHSACVCSHTREHSTHICIPLRQSRELLLLSLCKHADKEATDETEPNKQTISARGHISTSDAAVKPPRSAVGLHTAILGDLKLGLTDRT